VRIGIDAHALGTGAGGNETFVRQLLHGLAAADPDLDVVAYVHPEVHGDATAAAGFTTYPLALRSSWLRVPVGLPLAVRATRPDLLHVQYIAPPLCPVPFVVTLHDMVWRRFPETLHPVDRWRLAALVPGTLRRARRVFVVSQAMKREAMELYNVPGEKIDVVHNAVDPMYRPVTDMDRHAVAMARYGIDGPYIAFLGQLQPRKNVLRLAAAVARLREEGLTHKLVLIGKKSWLYGSIGEELNRLGLGDGLVCTGYVDRVDLPTLLSAADAFAYVSVYEGFGLPAAEAMACGAPVLVSEDPALREITGGAALSCNAFSVDAIAQALGQLLTDDTLRNRLRAKGPIQAARFTQEAMARAAIEGYRKALG
jgi:glycosyltransferase involved in cell wall biosynthesis